MFDKILIANRGEIACRIARTARKMGISTVAVYSDADASALHIKACDEAYLIGKAPAAESYLNTDVILDIARQSGAQAVHPGYGFLSENADFSRACKDWGIVFIGPSETAIISMGSKSEAKRLMSTAGVPLVPGYHEEDQSLDALVKASNAIDFPQLIKATAGGGGKGMRIVNSRDEFERALNSCKREAKAAFGDDKVLIERYLTSPRHVEFQIFADAHGNTVHLFERDCSVQRRYQKIIEEAPAPGVTDALRAAMGKAAIDAANAIGYIGAGTIEFLLDSDGQFYFMEMNTRLQVEHPITEKITGQDLVEWQFRVAAGEPLPLQQENLQINGHAFEARIYAESPQKDFLPATGTLKFLRTPVTSTNVRVDTGVCQGDEVSVFYDPMLAKLICWDTDRNNALRQMKKALSNFQILGIDTNLQFLSTVFSHSAFSDADIDTGFIEKHESTLLISKAEIDKPPRHCMLLACLYVLLHNKCRADTVQSVIADPTSPWGCGDGWQMNLSGFSTVELITSQIRTPITAYANEQGYQLEMSGIRQQVTGDMQDEHVLCAEIEGQKLTAAFIKSNQDISVLFEGNVWNMTVHNPLLDTTENEALSGSLIAPMPGSVIAVEISAGDKVKEGDVLMVVEAMKMEHSIQAPKEGKIKELFFAVGDQVEDGEALLSMED